MSRFCLAAGNVNYFSNEILSLLLDHILLEAFAGLGCLHRHLDSCFVAVVAELDGQGVDDFDL